MSETRKFKFADAVKVVNPLCHDTQNTKGLMGNVMEVLDHKFDTGYSMRVLLNDGRGGITAIYGPSELELLVL